jgi:hypothetical protein
MTTETCVGVAVGERMDRIQSHTCHGSATELSTEVPRGTSRPEYLTISHADMSEQAFPPQP